LQLSDTVNISATNGIVSANGVTSPTIYVNGKTGTTIQANQWNHIVITTATPIVANEISLGSNHTTYYSGRLDEIKAYPYARTKAQIQTDYNAGLAGISANEGTTASFGDASDKWMSDGLVGYWKMDESSWNGTSGEVKDASGNNNNGTAVNGATTGAGKFGSGGSFDGSNYVSINNSASLSSGVGNFAVTAWFKSNTSAPAQYIYNDYGSNVQNLISVAISGDNALLAYFRDVNGNILSVDLSNSVTDNNWHHVAWIKDGATAYLYLDGVLVGNNTNTAIGNINVSDGTCPSIGGYSCSSSYAFNGKIDETRIYNRALSPAEIKKLYDWAPAPVAHWKLDEKTGTSANDSSGNGNTGTLTNGPTWTQGKVGNGMNFDGSNDYVAIPDSNSLDTTSGVTLAGWVKFNALTEYCPVLNPLNQYC